MQHDSPTFVFDALMATNKRTRSRTALATMFGLAPCFDLACVGTSIRGAGALTFEAVTYLASADVVFYYPPTTPHYELLKLLNDDVVNLNDTLYVRGAPFGPTYEAIIEEVIGVLKTGKRIAYATQGSPAFHCGTCLSLIRRATQEGFRAVLIPGVSSLEVLSTDLAPLYDFNSLQLYSIDDVMNRKANIDPRNPCLLFDLGRYALPAVREKAGNILRSKLNALSEFLSSIYTSSHELILCSVKPDGLCVQSKTTLNRLEETVGRLGTSQTIFVPALQIASSS